jgi:nicotinamide/nicotinate riboside kinase
MNSEGEFWQDPPGYFEQLVYPAYTDAHRAMFAVCILPVTAANFHLRAHAKLQDADVENGSPLLPGLKLIEPLQMTMDDIVTSSCEELVSVLRRSKPLAVGGESATSANLN